MKTNYRIEVIHDDEPMNPREEEDNLGVMVCSHNRLGLGDPEGLEGLIGAICSSPKYRDSWEDYDSERYRDLTDPETVFKAAMELDVAILLPLYLYDHSGLSMNTIGFSCPWDSGQVGFIYALKNAIRKEYNKARISPKLRQAVIDRLIGEVKMYDQYLQGDVWGFVVTQYVEADDQEMLEEEVLEEEVASCWGFYGEEHCREEAQSEVAYFLEADKAEAVYEELNASTLPVAIDLSLIEGEAHETR